MGNSWVVVTAASLWSNDPSSQQDWVRVQQVGSGACHLLLSHSDASIPAEERESLMLDACWGIKPGLCFVRGAFEKIAWNIQAVYQKRRAG